MFKKKITALLVVATMMASVCACGNTTVNKESQSTSETKDTETMVISTEDVEEDLYYNKEGYPICDEEITLTALVKTDAAWDASEVANVVLFKEKFGINLDVQKIPSDVYNTKFQTMLTTNSLPDLVIGIGDGIAQAKQWAEQGFLLDFSQYLDIMPNFSAYLDENPQYKTYAYAGTDGIYALPRTTEPVEGKLAHTLINVDWLERVGKEVPTTLEELKDVLIAFRDQDANGNGDPNDEIPLLLNYSTGNFYGCTDWDEILNAFGIFARSDRTLRQVDENGTVYSGLVTDEYKAYLEFMNELYEEDLLWADAFIGTEDEAGALVAEDRVGIFSTKTDPAASRTASNEQEDAENRKFLLQFEELMGLTSEYNKVPTTVTGMGVTTWTMFFASADTEYPEAIARFVDAGFAVDNQSIFYGEIEGETVKKEELLLPDGTTFEWNAAVTLGDDTKYKTAVLPNSAFRYRSAVATALENMDLKPEEYTDEFIYNYRFNGLFYKRLAANDLTLVSMFPTSVYEGDEGDKVGIYKTDIQNLLAVWKADFITGSKDIEASWNEYESSLEAAGLKEYIAIEQAAYDRLNK